MPPLEDMRLTLTLGRDDGSHLRSPMTSRPFCSFIVSSVLASLIGVSCAEPPTTVVDDASTKSDLGVDVPPCSTCSIWQVRCGSRCVDLTTSPENCGACGVRCDGRAQLCRGGVCTDITTPCALVAGGDAGPQDAGRRDAARDSSNDTDSGTVLSDGSVTDGGDADVPVFDPTPRGLRGEYFATTDLRSLQRIRLDPTIDFDWSEHPPADNVSRENFSVRWVGTVTPEYSEAYTFITRSDDGVRLSIDGRMLIDNWTPHGTTEDTATVSLSAGQRYAIELKYFQGTGAATVRLEWESPSVDREVVPRSRLLPGDGVDQGCAGGVCCPAGGRSPVCCAAGSRCVLNVGYAGCCPTGEDCGEEPLCRMAQ